MTTHDFVVSSKTDSCIKCGMSIRTYLMTGYECGQETLNMKGDNKKA